MLNGECYIKVEQTYIRFCVFMKKRVYTSLIYFIFEYNINLINTVVMTELERNILADLLCKAMLHASTEEIKSIYWTAASNNNIDAKNK